MSLEKYQVNESKSVLETLSHMEKNHIKFVFAVDSSGKVTGTLSDGDIRRGIIGGRLLENPISAIINRSFEYSSSENDFEEVISIFHKRKIDFIPILDPAGRLYNIITRHTLNSMLLMNQRMSFDYDFDIISETILEHEIFVRPWGYYKTMVLNEKFQSKVIYILPEQSLSLQSHKHREEHWTVVCGKGRVQLDDSVHSAESGDVFFIPKGCKHRMFNDSPDEIMVLSEVQLGDYFGEDDIERYADVYGRV